MDEFAATLRQRVTRASNALAFSRVSGDEGAARVARAALADLQQQAAEHGIALDSTPAPYAAPQAAAPDTDAATRGDAR
jgi:hypothetical protein